MPITSAISAAYNIPLIPKNLGNIIIIGTKHTISLNNDVSVVLN